jgi:hypothetical protein
MEAVFGEFTELEGMHVPDAALIDAYDVAGQAMASAVMERT